MKIVQINEFCGKGSTGKIAVAISDRLNVRGIENYIFYTSGFAEYSQGISYMGRMELKFQALKSRVFGNYGFNSYCATKRLVKYLKKMQPNVVHLHNLHGHNCNLEVLFNYLRKYRIKTYWTFHDCWAFTGYCPHYDMIGCSKWKNQCHQCPQKRKYSWYIDRSSQMQKRKKSIFRDINLTIICPSMWMADQVSQSFLKDFETKVIYNGVNLDVFRPRMSDFAQKYNCEGKFIVLGVSNIWVYQKGTDVFIELAKRLDDRFQVMMVGTDATIDKMLPDNIISIHRTQSQEELAEIYTAASVFVNPTRQEVLGLTNIEALACGTPVVMFDTGGSPECIDSSCGIAVAKDDIDAMVHAIVRYCTEINVQDKKPYAITRKFDADLVYKQYCDLYN